MTNLLPISASQLELFFERLATEEIELPVNIKDLWNADKCPEHLLPWLAHTLSVDYWDDDWFEDVKRKAIKTSIANHAIKGTKQSIKNALAVLGIVADVIPWHEASGDKPKFSFEVIAWVNEQIKPNEFLINPDLSQQAHRMIDAHKSLRDEYVLKVGTQHMSSIALASVISTTTYREFSGATYVPEFESPIHVSSIGKGTVYAEFTGATL